MSIATPKAYPVDLDMLEVARQAAEEFGNGSVVEVCKGGPEEAVKGADVLVTDTWYARNLSPPKKKHVADTNLL